MKTFERVSLLWGLNDSPQSTNRYSHANLKMFIFFTRMAAPKWRKTTMARSPNGVPGRSLSSSLRLNPVYSSSHLPTPVSRPTRATCAHLYASQTTPSPYPPTHLRQSSAPFAKALASTSPPSCLLLQPAVRVCLLLLRRNRPHAACCVPVS